MLMRHRGRIRHQWVNNLKKADDFTIAVGDSIITRKEEITYLGSTLEANLSGDKMASKVIKKVNQRTRFLYRATDQQ